MGAGQEPTRMAQPTAFEQSFLEPVNRVRLDPAVEAARLGIGVTDGLGTGTIKQRRRRPWPSTRC